MIVEGFGARTFELRDYQHAAVESLLSYFEENDGNPILALPTGAGKSVIQAAFIRRVLDQWPGERFLLISHVKELLVQNAAKLEAMVPGVSVGVYSAGLGRKEAGYQITVAGIQSVYKKAHRMGDVSICIVDECHLVSKSGGTMYERFFGELRQFCPHVKVVGMSATPYRLDSGPLIRGDARIFTDIAYSISIKDLIEQGYLAPLTTAPTTAKADTSNVKMRGGEYITGDLERAMNKASVTDPALDEAERLCAGRRSWLVFCVGVDHAREVCKTLEGRGHRAAVVVGDTPKAERDRHIEAFKRGELRALVSVGVLTTGFDAPNADALICLRPTQSPGLWVQMVGRVSRIAPGKDDGLVLDFTSNTRTHGPVDLIEVDGDGNVKTSPLTDCEECGAEIQRSATECPQCGHKRMKDCKSCKQPMPVRAYVCEECGAHQWSEPREPKHTDKASSASILSDADSSMREAVKTWSFTRHTKEGKPDSVRVWYDVDWMTTYSEWLCFDHGGYASQKAAMWWVRHGGNVPTPTTTDEALRRTEELTMPEAVRVKKDGKWWRVSKTILGEAAREGAA